MSFFLSKADFISVNQDNLLTYNIVNIKMLLQYFRNCENIHNLF